MCNGRVSRTGNFNVLNEVYTYITQPQHRKNIDLSGNKMSRVVKAVFIPPTKLFARSAVHVSLHGAKFVIKYYTKTFYSTPASLYQFVLQSKISLVTRQPHQQQQQRIRSST